MKNIAITFLSLVVIFSSCTENKRAKTWGGTETINLPANRKLVTITWKQTNLWYLTKPMSKNDSAEEYNFHEESSLGLMEGTVVIKESKE